MAFDEPMHSDLQKIVDNINKVMVGKKDIAILSLVAILAKGHVAARGCAWCREDDDGSCFGKIHWL